MLIRVFGPDIHLHAGIILSLLARGVSSDTAEIVEIVAAQFWSHVTATIELN